MGAGLMGFARAAKASDIGYKRGRLSTTVPALPVTDAYRAGCDQMGLNWNRLNAYCSTCGSLPAWCECPKQAEQGSSNGH